MNPLHRSTQTHRAQSSSSGNRPLKSVNTTTKPSLPIRNGNSSRVFGPNFEFSSPKSNTRRSYHILYPNQANTMSSSGGSGSEKGKRKLEDIESPEERRRALIDSMVHGRGFSQPRPQPPKQDFNINRVQGRREDDRLAQFQTAKRPTPELPIVQRKMSSKQRAPDMPRAVSPLFFEEPRASDGDVRKSSESHHSSTFSTNGASADNCSGQNKNLLQTLLSRENIEQSASKSIDHSQTSEAPLADSIDLDATVTTDLRDTTNEKKEHTPIKSSAIGSIATTVEDFSSPTSAVNTSISPRRRQTTEYEISQYMKTNILLNFQSATGNKRKAFRYCDTCSKLFVQAAAAKLFHRMTPSGKLELKTNEDDMLVVTIADCEERYLPRGDNEAFGEMVEEIAGLDIWKNGNEEVTCEVLVQLA